MAYGIIKVDTITYTDGGSDQSNAFPLAARKVTGAFPVDRPRLPAEPFHEHPRLAAGRKSEPCVCDQSSKHPPIPPREDRQTETAKQAAEAASVNRGAIRL